MINELLPNPSGDEKTEEWVELFNAGGEAVDVNGFVLKDAADHILTIDATYVDGSTVIESHSWLVIRRNNHPDFSLNNSGTEEIYLFNNSSTNPLDSFFYQGSGDDRSWGRIPDGGEISAQQLEPSPGSSNIPPPTPTPTPTPKPTSTPVPTSSPTPTPAPTKTPPTLTPIPTSSQVLGDVHFPREIDADQLNLYKSEKVEEDVEGLGNEDEDKEGRKLDLKIFLFPLIISLLGLTLLGIAAAPFVKKELMTRRFIRSKRRSKKKTRERKS